MSFENYAPSLVDRTVFVTGGATASVVPSCQEFARQGSKVAFVDINPEHARHTIERSVEAGAAHTPIFYKVDLCDIEALQAAGARAIDDLGA